MKTPSTQALSTFDKLKRFLTPQENESISPRTLNQKIQTWFSESSNNFTLNELLELRSIPENQELVNAVLVSWISRRDNNISLEDCEKALESMDGMSKLLFLYDWLKKAGNNMPFAKVHELVSPYTNADFIDYTNSVMVGWMQKNLQHDLETLEKILPFIFPLEKIHVAEFWFEHNNAQIQTLQHLETLVELMDYSDYQQILEDWSETHPEEITREKIAALKPSVFKDVVRSMWIDNNNVGIEYIESLIDAGEEIRASFSTWLEKDGNNISEEKLKTLLTKINDPVANADILSRWHLKEGNSLSFQDFKSYLMPLKDFDQEKDHILETNVRLWINKPENNFAPDELLEIIEIAKDPYIKNEILGYWLEKNQNNNIDFKKFFEVVSLLENTANEDIITRNVKLWIARNGINLAQYKELLLLIQNDVKHFEILDIMLSNFANATDVAHKSFEEKVERITQLINEGLIDRYDTASLGVFGQLAHFSAEELSNLTNILYPNSEALRIKLFLDAGTIQQMRGQHHVIKAFLGSIRDTDNASYFISQAFRIFQIRSSEVLNICSDRKNPQYFAIESVFQERLVKDCILPDGVSFLSARFGGNVGSTKMVDIFTYFDLVDPHNIMRFFGFIQPQIIQELKAQFQSQSLPLYLSDREQDYLRTLVDLKFPEIIPVTSITSYLISQTPPAIELTPEVIDNYQIFKGDLSEKQIRLNAEFRNLLRDDLENTPENAQRVTDFLIEVTGRSLDAGATIKDYDKQNFLNLFKTRKAKLAALFETKDGLDRFSKALYSAGDGCIVNISGQFERAYLMSVLPNASDRLLYSFFIDKISGPILNSGDDYLLDLSQANELQNQKVNQHVFSPQKLFELLRQNVTERAYNDTVQQTAAISPLARDDSDHLKYDEGALLVADVLKSHIRKFCNVEIIVTAKVDEIMKNHQVASKIATYLALEPIRIHQIFAAPEQMNLFESLGQKDFTDAQELSRYYIKKDHFSAEGLTNFIKKNQSYNWEIIRERISATYSKNDDIITEMEKFLKPLVTKSSEIKSEDIAIFMVLDAREDLGSDKFKKAGIFDKVEEIKSLLGAAHTNAEIAVATSKQSPDSAVEPWFSGQISSTVRGSQGKFS